MEREREMYSNRIKDYSRNQEQEIQGIRNKWNQELMDERSKMEQYFKEEIQLWQDRARIAEKKLKDFKELQQNINI